MNAKRKPIKRHPSSTDQITVRRAASSGGYELVFPRSVTQRADDMDEVRKMLAAEEIDVAEDELRWLVGGCAALLEGHKLLGQIAAADQNWDLARVHFAYAYELGLNAAKKVALPYMRPANRDLHEAGRGLVEALVKLGETDTARSVAKQLLAWDLADPLGVNSLLHD